MAGDFLVAVGAAAVGQIAGDHGEVITANNDLAALGAVGVWPGWPMTFPVYA